MYQFLCTYFFQEHRLSSFMPLPFHTFRKMSFDHSFLSKGVEFSAFFKSFFFHSSLLYQSMLLGGGGCWMSKCSFIILHCFVTRWGDWFYIYIYTFFKNLFYHPSVLYQSMLLGRGAVGCQSVLLSSCIALSFHTTRERLFYPYSLLWEGIGF